MDYVATFNLVEAVFWGLCGGIALLAAIGSTENRTVLFLAAVALFAFGGSDLVEIQTGAWWRPWWLLVWKGVCLTTLCFGAFELFSEKSTIPDEESREVSV